MIIYRDQHFASRLSKPPWLEGASDLHIREDADGRLFAIGDGRLVGPAPAKEWQDLGDGWQARLVQPFHPVLLLRKPLWCPLRSVTDQQGRQWMVPQILQKEDGVSLIEATYGPGWIPDYTPAQTKALAVAHWSRQNHASEAPVAVSTACNSAAELLSACYYLTPEVIAVLRLLDNGLMTAVLRRAAGFTD